MKTIILIMAGVIAGLVAPIVAASRVRGRNA
jgi:hypothetical protein